MSLRKKINVVLLVVVVIPFFGLIIFSLLRTHDHVRYRNARINIYGKDGREMPHAKNFDFVYQVENPLVFEIGVDRIRLLGIKEPAEEDRRQQAIEFVKAWLEKARKHAVNFGSGVQFENWSQALQDERGTWLVWATAYYAVGGKQHCLNVELVEEGFADVAYSDHLRYEFREPEYGGFGTHIKWREMLDKANEARTVPK